MRHSSLASHMAVAVLLVAFPLSAAEPSPPSAPVTSLPASPDETAGTPEAEGAPSTESGAVDAAANDATVSEISPPSGTVTPSPATEQTTEGADASPASQAYRPPPPPPRRAPDRHTGPRKLMLLLGPGFGFSFMYPKAVNKYLDHWAERRGVEIQDGSTAIILSLMPRVAVTFAPIEYVQIQAVGEIGWAPKVLTVLDPSMESYTESFHFLRYSVGGTVTGHLPVAHGRGSVFLGGGALFNVLTFGHYQEITPGYRGVLGYRFYGRRAFSPEIFFEFNYINAETRRTPGVYDPDDIDELNYTSGTIGVNFYFKAVEK